MKKLNIILNNKVEKFNPVTVYPEKYRISVNPWFGCNLGCKYCIQSNDLWYSPHNKVNNKKDAINNTIATISNLKPILPMFNISMFDFSDPFLKSNIKPLFKILNYLDNLKENLSIFITTKLNPGELIIKRLRIFKNLNISLFVSIGTTDKKIEPVDLEKRLELIKTAYQNKIFTTVAFKPYVPQWLSKDEVKNILKSLNRCFHNILIAPLKLNKGVTQMLNYNNLDIPDVNLINKKINILRKELKNIYPEKIITSRRSCGANFHFKRICNRAMDFAIKKYKNKLDERIKLNFSHNIMSCGFDYEKKYLGDPYCYYYNNENYDSDKSLDKKRDSYSYIDIWDKFSKDKIPVDDVTDTIISKINDIVKNLAGEKREIKHSNDCILDDVIKKTVVEINDIRGVKN